MATIRCKACGKTYNYAKEGFCPKCGAYNRPPRQEWVDAEGGIHYAGQEKECYERKECHEEKVCYEEQTRRPRPHIQWRVPKKNTASGAIGAVIAVSIVIALINTLRGCVADNFGGYFGGKEEITPDYGWSDVAPAEEIESTVREYAEFGAVFTVRGTEYTVTDAWTDGGKTYAAISEGEEYQTFPELCCQGTDGNEWWFYPEDVEIGPTGENTFICVYGTENIPERNIAVKYLVFYDMDRQVWAILPSEV